MKKINRILSALEKELLDEVKKGTRPLEKRLCVLLNTKHEAREKKEQEEKKQDKERKLALREAFRKNMKVWKTLEMGRCISTYRRSDYIAPYAPYQRNYADWSELRKAILESGSRIALDRYEHVIENRLFWNYSDRSKTNQLIGAEKWECDLVILSPREVGLDDMHEDLRSESFPEKVEKEFGLTPCSIEVCLQLRLQYTDQPLGERCYIVTRKIKRDCQDIGNAEPFLAHDKEGLLLGMCYRGESWVHESMWYGADNKIVFMKPRPKR